MKYETVIILDFGGLYNQLIARKIRDNNIFCEVLPFDTPLSEIKAKNPKGIIFTGGPVDATDEEAPLADKGIFELGIPILGICYGCQFIGYSFGSDVMPVELNENSVYNAEFADSAELFSNINKNADVMMSNTYALKEAPSGFEITAKTENCIIAAIENKSKKLYAFQFHPEIVETPLGNQILKNFLFNICNLKGDWEMNEFALNMIETLKEKIGSKKALCALSGGVDSTVSAIMIQKAIGDNLICIFVDHGLMRLNEGDEVMEVFKKFGLNVIRVNAQDRFLDKLKDVIDHEKKSKIIGEEFIRVFEEEAKKIGDIDFLVQGTIYPDIIESGTKDKAVIKSHHNVGGLPDVINFKEIIEPLRDLFKDEVRKVGLALGIDESLVFRQPFPGPGLGVRVIGEITKEKLDILRHTDFIYREEIKKANLDRVIWQYFTVLTGLKSVGVFADERTYAYTVALRAVTSVDAMTATWYPIPFDILDIISKRIVNEVPHVNRIVLDITSKPPATIEWE